MRAAQRHGSRRRPRGPACFARRVWYPCLEPARAGANARGTRLQVARRRLLGGAPRRGRRPTAFGLAQDGDDRMPVTDDSPERHLRVGVLTGAGNHEDVGQQLSPLGAVEWCERTDALLGAAAGGRFDAVVTGPENEDGRSIAATLVDLAALCPALPVVIHSRVNLATIEKLIGVMAVAMRTQCVVRPFARIEPVLRHLCSPAYGPSAVPLLLVHVMPVLPEGLGGFFALAIFPAATRPGVDQVPRWNRSA